MTSLPMLHVWYIYLQNWVILRANVGRYTSTMEHMGSILGVKQKVPDHDIQTVTPCWDTTVVPSGKHSQFAIEHGPVEIVDLASYKMVIFQFAKCECLPGRVHTIANLRYPAKN